MKNTYNPEHQYYYVYTAELAEYLQQECGYALHHISSNGSRPDKSVYIFINCEMIVEDVNEYARKQRDKYKTKPYVLVFKPSIARYLVNRGHQMEQVQSDRYEGRITYKFANNLEFKADFNWAVQETKAGRRI